MARKNKNYSVDEVVRDLTKKGCVITLENPITSTTSNVVLLSEEEITKKFVENIKVGKKMSLEEIKNISEKDPKKVENWFLGFKKHHESLFKPRKVTSVITLQDSYVINCQKADGLGNNSLGKIDFLLKHSGLPFNVIR